ncbi:MAG: flagellar assembly protein FliH [Rhodocyclaceae bacterium]
MAAVIPKEKLTAFQRWELGSFDPVPPPPLEAAPEPDPAPPPVAEPEPELASEPMPHLSFPTVGELEAIHQEAHKAGYDAGYEEGTARARMEALRLHTLAESLEEAMGQLDQRIADDLVSFSMELARRMVSQALKVQPDLVVATVREALQQLFHGHATVHLHPEDASLVKTFLTEQAGHGGHRVFEDETIARGGCRVEAAGSQVDATMETRWRRIAETLGRNDNWFGPDSQ